MSKSSKKILVTGGGTGGHVYPLMAIIDVLKQNDANILYVGSGSEIEVKLAKEKEISYKQVLSGKYRRYFSWENFIDFFKVIFGFIQSFFIVLFFWPDKVFSKGGYVGLPVIYASWVLGRPIYIHETDAHLGLANKIALPKCKKLFISFPPKFYPEIPAKKIVYTGNPIRADFLKIKKEKLFADERKTILVTGGSQGARFINQTIAAIMEQLTDKYNIIFVTGKLDYPWIIKNNWKHCKLYDFTSDLPKYLFNCDLIISRSGGTLFEIAYCRKPAILIPLPSAANDHQEANARILEKENAAVILREKGLTPDSMYEIINRLMEDKKLLEDLSQKISSFSKEDAAKIIAQEIMM